ncbi:MAG TPA: hypothetical protein PLS98_09765 [Dictyoglomaceae bacterium]|nr:hypothetical protein [Dictyoglomaceae bacterium]
MKREIISVKGKKISVELVPDYPRYCIVRITFEGKTYDGMLQDWRDRKKASYPGIYFKMNGQEIYMQISVKDYEELSKEAEELMEGAKLNFVVKREDTTIDADGYEIPTVRYNHIPVIPEDKNGEFINSERVKDMLVKENIKEITIRDLINLWNTKYADSHKKAMDKVKEIYRREYENDKVEVGEEQALKNLFGDSKIEKEEREFERKGEG